MRRRPWLWFLALWSGGVLSAVALAYLVRTLLWLGHGAV